MDNYSNNIDLFDSYLNGTMSENDKSEFEAKLNSDSNFRHEFTFHKKLVAIIQHTVRGTDLEFENALRAISDSDFKNIVEKEIVEKASQQQGRYVSLKKVYRWCAVAAAAVIITVVGGYKFYQDQTRNKLCDAIFSAGFNPDITMTRGVDQSLTDSYIDAVNKLNNGDTDDAISSLELLYNVADDEMKVEYGTALAYAYVKAHDLEKAWGAINKVKAISLQLYGENTDELEALIRVLEEQNLN